MQVSSEWFEVSAYWIQSSSGAPIRVTYVNFASSLHESVAWVSFVNLLANCFASRSFQCPTHTNIIKEYHPIQEIYNKLQEQVEEQAQDLMQDLKYLQFEEKKNKQNILNAIIQETIQEINIDDNNW